MNLVKVIIDNSSGRVWGQSIVTDNSGKEKLSVKPYTGLKSAFAGGKKVVDNKSITIYDLRL